MTKRGYYPGRSPDVILIPKEPHLYGTFDWTSHSGPWPYMQEVPLVFYGPGSIRQGRRLSPRREVTVADIAPTVGRLIGSDLPGHRAGTVLQEALEPEERRGLPRLVVVIVWDGGGTNVLRRWPDAWPFLSRIMRRGTSVENATVGSSPSLTPPVHATIGTGAYPEDHGIVDIPQRGAGVVKDSYRGRSPRFLELSTIADLHDAATGNAAMVGMFGERAWHLGMMGHGSFWPGGDKDIAVMLNESGELVTNHDYYRLPPGIKDVSGFEHDVQTVDAVDGELDGAWMGHTLEDTKSIFYSPVWALYQNRLVKELISKQGFGKDAVPDLFFINYKPIDLVGHWYNMVSPEMEVTLRYTDRALRQLVGFLNEQVGIRRWALVLTADHGQGPAPRTTGAWPISEKVLSSDLAEHLGVSKEDLVEDDRPLGLWLDHQTLQDRGITLQEISRFFMDYRIVDTLGSGDEMPEQYAGREEERLMAAVFPGKALGRIWRCAQRNADRLSGTK